MGMLFLCTIICFLSITATITNTHPKNIHPLFKLWPSSALYQNGGGDRTDEGQLHVNSLPLWLVHMFTSSPPSSNRDALVTNNVKDAAIMTPVEKDVMIPFWPEIAGIGDNNDNDDDNSFFSNNKENSFGEQQKKRTLLLPPILNHLFKFKGPFDTRSRKNHNHNEILDFFLESDSDSDSDSDLKQNADKTENTEDGIPEKRLSYEEAERDRLTNILQHYTASLLKKHFPKNKMHPKETKSGNTLSGNTPSGTASGQDGIWG